VTRSRPDAAASEPAPPAADQSACEKGEEVVSLTAPGQTDEPAAVVDLTQVTPAPAGYSPLARAATSVAAGLTFALLTVWIARQGTAVPNVDEQIHTWAVSHRGPGSTALARAVTWGGVTTVVLPALLAVGALAGSSGGDFRRRLGDGVLLSGVASVGVFAGLRINALVGRGRPSVADWAGAAGGPAFPSGHTTAATLFAASCAWTISARVRAGWPRRAIWAGAIVYAAAVGWSRVWLGVHWPTDVIGGWLYGTAWFTAATAAMLGLRRRSARRRAARA
jgi:membrane-associated phospholipid phosphatase